MTLLLLLCGCSGRPVEPVDTPSASEDTRSSKAQEEPPVEPTPPEAVAGADRQVPAAAAIDVGKDVADDPKEQEATGDDKRATLHTVPRPILKQVTVEGTCNKGSLFGYPAVAVQRLVAFMKDDPRYHRFEMTSLRLTVGAVLSGKLHDEDLPNQPPGVDSIRVVAVADAAIALEKSRDRSQGTWRLSVLPDGTYLVADLDNTPFGGADISREVARIASAGKSLRSGVARRQHRGLLAFWRQPKLSLVPDIIPILDSEEKVVDPFAHGDTATGPVYIRREVSLGSQARRVAHRAVARLRDRHSPARGDSAKVWREWWRKTLELEPFPRIEVEATEATALTTLGTSKSWPVQRIDPRGRFAVIGVSRLNPPVNNAHSGIRLVEMGSPMEDDFIYKPPLDERNCVPTGLAVGWRKEAIAVAWKEYGYDKKRNTVKFLCLDPKRRSGQPVDLKLKGMSHLAMCPWGKNNWLLACAAKPADLDPTDRSSRQLKEIYLAVLDSSGNIQRRTLALELPVTPMFSYHDMVSAMSMAGTPEGPAITYMDTKIGKTMGAYLALLTPELKMRRTVRIDDPNQRGFISCTHVAFDGQTLCAAWIHNNTLLFVRTFSLLGDPSSDARLVADAVTEITRPTPIANGFVIAWTDSSETRFQVRLAAIGATGAVGEHKVVRDGKAMLRPIALAVRDGKARVMMHSWHTYPRRILLKDVTLDGAEPE